MTFNTKLLAVYPAESDPVSYRGVMTDAASASTFVGLDSSGNLVAVPSSQPGTVVPVVTWDSIQGKPEFFPTTWKLVQQRPFYGPPPGTVCDYFGSAQVVLTGVFATDSVLINQLNGGTISSPFWRVCDGTNGTPDLRGRFRLGAGPGAGLTNRVFGAAGGIETNALTTAAGGNPNYLSSASAADNNMPPFSVCYPIIRTERLE